jgi:alkanesulfonate monooxygenase SsuD/methylene tetrahydromethanopterin reductase-like flavin-dependent oxidoreductase (luciferase family)
VLRYAIGLPTVGEFGDVNVLTALAVRAEEAGWDGVHLWDHLLFHDPAWPVTSSTVAAAAIANATSRIRIILTMALPRRQVQDVAQDTAALDALSGGRLTLVATLGSIDREYTDFGLDADLRVRGRQLDLGLERLSSLWAEWGAPPIPIWCGALWPHRAGLRRAARFDGAMPTFADQRVRNVPPSEFAAASSFVRGLNPALPDLAMEGATDAASAAGQVAGYAGLTWWIEALGWWRGGLATAGPRIDSGPPR